MEAFIGNVTSFEAGVQNILQISFGGCNFKCPWCNVPHLLDAKEEYRKPLRDVKAEIRQNISSVEGVVFTGGEPCLQRPSLINLSRFCRENHLKVYVHTNGSKPECINSLLEKRLVDTMIVDLKSPFNDTFEKITKSETFFISNKQLMEDIRDSLKILEKANIDIEIRTTIIPGWMYRKEDLLEIAELIKNIECRWKLQTFKPDRLVSKKLSDIVPPSYKFMENLRDYMQKKYPNTRIYID